MLGLNDAKNQAIKQSNNEKKIKFLRVKIKANNMNTRIALPKENPCFNNLSNKYITTPIALNSKPSLWMPLHQNKNDGIKKIEISKSHFLLLNKGASKRYIATKPNKKVKLKITMLA